MRAVLFCYFVWFVFVSGDVGAGDDDMSGLAEGYFGSGWGCRGLGSLWLLH